jgi:hypothetical protein
LDINLYELGVRELNMSSLLRLALLMAALAFTSTASYAQGAAGANCKPMRTATGSAALGEAAAKASAIANWRRTVILNYGESHSEYAVAQKNGDPKCGKTMLGLTRCEVTAAPCEKAGAAQDNGGINIPAGPNDECSPDADRCVKIVKWVQRRLKERGYYDLDVDGIPGQGTAKAIRRYKRDKNIGGAPDDIDEALINSLRA